MRTLLNIIWFVLCGLWLSLAYVIAGVLACVFIITIPFGIASFRIASFVIWPFGRTVIPAPGSGAVSCVGNALWFVLGGFGTALAHLITAVLLALTIVGIPLAVANLKMIPVTCFPFGKQIVRISDLHGRSGLVSF